jgi:methyl-accepting chemotaxis protein
MDACKRLQEIRLKLRRRQYINDAGYQMKIVIVFVMITLLVNIISIGVFNYIALQQMEDVIWSSHINIKTTGEIMNSLFIYVNMINVCFITCMLVLMGYWMIRKTAAPLMSMSADIHNMTGGDLMSAIALRKKDEFQDVAVEIDTMRESMRGRIERISAQHNEVSASIKKLGGLKGHSASLAAESEIIREKVKRLEEEIRKLKF